MKYDHYHYLSNKMEELESACFALHETDKQVYRIREHINKIIEDLTVENIVEKNISIENYIENLKLFLQAFPEWNLLSAISNLNCIKTSLRNKYRK